MPESVASGAAGSDWVETSAAPAVDADGVNGGPSTRIWYSRRSSTRPRSCTRLSPTVGKVASTVPPVPLVPRTVSELPSPLCSTTGVWIVVTAAVGIANSAGSPGAIATKIVLLFADPKRSRTERYSGRKRPSSVLISTSPSCGSLLIEICRGSVPFCKNGTAGMLRVY